MKTQAEVSQAIENIKADQIRLSQDNDVTEERRTKLEIAFKAEISVLEWVLDNQGSDLR